MLVKRYEGRDDLRAMQALAQRIWSPKSRWHIGDLAWGRFMHVGREAEWPTALWVDAAGDVLAWGWIELPNHLDLLVDPAQPDLAIEVLDWFERTATSEDRTVTVLDTEKHLTDALIARNYQPKIHGPFFMHCSMPLTSALPEPKIPEGFLLRHIEKEDVEARVRVHQAAFNQSRVSVESYLNIMDTWPYRADLDWVVEAPSGEFAAFALAWLDDKNGVGELEPVGTIPAYQGLGLASAVSLAALHALKTAGAKNAVVYPRGDDAYPIPARLYNGMGFVPHARTVTFSR